LSETQWLKKRRAAVDALADSCKKRTYAEMEASSRRQSAAAWTATHEALPG
jgi:hypothetical protein